jgi:hypothetical protein
MDSTVTLTTALTRITVIAAHCLDVESGPSMVSRPTRPTTGGAIRETPATMGAGNILPDLREAVTLAAVMRAADADNRFDWKSEPSKSHGRSAVG